MPPDRSSLVIRSVVFVISMFSVRAQALECSVFIRSFKGNVHVQSPARVEDSLQLKFDRVLRLSSEAKTERVAELRAAIHEIAELVENRPITSANLGSFDVTFLSGGFTDMVLGDIASPVARSQMKTILEGIGIRENMWLGRGEEEMPTKGNWGRARVISELEHGLSLFYEHIQGESGANGFQASKALDILLKREQVYLDLEPVFLEALHRDYTLVSFMHYRGVVLPPKFPGELVGAQAMVRVIDDPQMSRTVAESYAYSLKRIDAWLDLATRLEDGQRPTETEMPEFPSQASTITAEQARYRAKNLQRMTRTLVPSAGIYEGKVVEQYPAGFDLQIGPDSVLSININNSMGIEAIAIKPLEN